MMYSNALQRIALLVLLGNGLCQCSPPEPAPVSGRGSLSGQSSQLSDDGGPPPKQYKGFKEIIDLSILDSADFAITNVAVGIQEYLSYDSINISYKFDARYIDTLEIIRCESDLPKIYTGLSEIDITEIELVKMSAREKTNFYRNSDLWFYLSNSEYMSGKCTYLTTMTPDNNYWDTWAKSGSYRYFIRACVNPERMPETTGMKRYCSTRVAISSELTDFKNRRQEDERFYLQMRDQYEAKSFKSAQNILTSTYQYTDALSACEVKEEIRATKKAVAGATAQLTASVMEVTMEFFSVKNDVAEEAGGSFIRYYTRTFSLGSMGDRLFMMGAAGGMAFGDLFRSVASSPEFIPRTCEKALKLARDVKTYTEEWLINIHLRTLWNTFAILMRNGEKIMAEEDIPLLDPNFLEKLDVSSVWDNKGIPRDPNDPAASFGQGNQDAFDAEATACPEGGCTHMQSGSVHEGGNIRQGGGRR